MHSDYRDLSNILSGDTFGGLTWGDSTYSGLIIMHIKTEILERFTVSSIQITAQNKKEKPYLQPPLTLYAFCILLSAELFSDSALHARARNMINLRIQIVLASIIASLAIASDSPTPEISGLTDRVVVEPPIPCHDQPSHPRKRRPARIGKQETKPDAFLNWIPQSQSKPPNGRGRPALLGLARKRHPKGVSLAIDPSPTDSPVGQSLTVKGSKTSDINVGPGKVLSDSLDNPGLRRKRKVSSPTGTERIEAVVVSASSCRSCYNHPYIRFCSTCGGKRPAYY